MKAAQINQSMSIRTIEAERPKAGPGELLIKVKTVGICGTDLKLFDGSISYLKDGLLEFPHIPGHEWAGEVVEVGTVSSKFQPGDRVTGECHIGCGSCEECSNGRQNICDNRLRFGILQDGGLAEYIVLPEKAAHKIPNHVTDEEAALVEPLTVALYAMDKLEKVAGATVLITGLGPIGLLVSEVARIMGAACIIGADINPHALQQGKEMGCDVVIDSSKENLEERMMTLTDGLGPEIIIEATGVNRLFPSILNIARVGGQISLIGLYSNKVELDANLIIRKDLRVNGNMASARVWERAIRLISSKKLDISNIITHKFSIEDVDRAFKKAYDKEDNVTKVMIHL